MKVPQELPGLISRYGYAAHGSEAEAVALYVELLEKWNARVNLVSSCAWPILGPLLEEAIWAAASYSAGSVRHLDLGSGAGFPALVMKILRPHMRLTLVEARERRAAFLQTALEALGLPNAQAVCAKIEDHLAASPGGWDCVSWKALRLGRHAARLLLERAEPATEHWVFHSAGLPCEDVSFWEAHTRLARRDSCPAKPGWRLSVFRVGCFT